MKSVFFLSTIIPALSCTDIIAQDSGGIDKNTFGEINARQIGPATITIPLNENEKNA